MLTSATTRVVLRRFTATVLQRVEKGTLRSPTGYPREEAAEWLGLGPVARTQLSECDFEQVQKPA